MRKLSFFLVVVLTANVTSPALLGGIPSDKAVYRGGTVAAVADGAEGAVTTTNEQYFEFDYRRGRYRIAYERVNFLEFGQKAGRRLGLALAFGLPILFSKKRRHFLTINFLDEDGKQQAMVFELGKSIVRRTLVSIEARTGKRIEYQDDDARRMGSN